MKKIKKNNLQKMCVLALIAVMGVTITACSNSKVTEAVTEETVIAEVIINEETSEKETSEEETGEKETNEKLEGNSEVVATDITVLGEGTKSFFFDVIFEDGSVNSYEVHTEATTVGEALLDQELIEGEISQYGMYVKVVDGVTLDYDTDGAYWGFLVDGEMAIAGVDTTEIETGITYAFTYAQ
ncbi:MAG: DUF4430 domain-containing protein [Eubacteriales bacterium]